MLKRDYSKLSDYLSEQKKLKDFILTFEEIEEILDCKLPKSAYIHNAWWANDKTHVQSKWLTACFKTKNVKLGENITFYLDY